MLNNEIELRTSAEACTQIASYFDIVDNCIALSDTNKQYTISPQTSYSPSPPVPSGSYTSAIISPNTNNTADIYNGFIRADMEVSIKEAAGKAFEPLTSDGYQFNRVWFGFKDARDAVEKYEIVANGITIYTQNFGCEESFLTACCANETTKRADVYSKARHKDIWNYKSGSRTGFVVDWKERNGKKWTEQKYKIHLKIDLRRFLPLSNIKYLPAFAGKIELRLFFSCAGMVCCPIGPGATFEYEPNVYSKYAFDQITNEFTPINEKITMYTKKENLEDNTRITGTAGSSTAIAAKINFIHLKTEDRTFQVVDYSITECSSIIPCFGIEDNIYSSLVQRYADPTHPLTFPTQTLSVYTTTNKLKNPNDKTTCTITPRFVDSIFCLFPVKHTHHTYFKNPNFKSFQLNCGGYGNIPAKPFGTTDEYPEFLEYCQNAMNMNGEQSGFNKEVVNSLTYCNRDSTTDKPKFGYSTGLGSNDKTSFFIGLPTETDNTYQQGLTSLSPINFEINVSQETGSLTYANAVETPPLICLLFDSSISILVQPNGMPPLVRLGNYDLTTPQ